MSAKPLVGLEPLPHEAGAPVVEETPRPTLASVVPEVAERLLQQASGVEPLVGGQQQRKRALAVQAEIVAMRQQRVLLALDEAPILAAQAAYSALRTFSRARSTRCCRIATISAWTAS